MRAITVGLLWHSINSPNLGVSALTYSQIYLVDKAAKRVGVQVKFVLIGWVRPGEGASDPRVIGVCQINARRLLGVDKSLRNSFDMCDLVLDIGEGDSFSDIYGWKRLIYITVSKVLAARKGRPLVMSPQTIGPFKRPLAAIVGDLAMQRATVICTRDGLSSEYLRSRDVRKRTHEAVDVAFALPFDRKARSVDKLMVGINVSGLLWAGGYTGSNQFGLKLDYRKTILEIIDNFLKIENVEVVIVPHVVIAERQNEDDLFASHEIRSLRPNVSVVGPFGNPVEAKSFISSLDFFTGARMHACIGAFSAGVPCVPMAYSRKFVGLFNTLEYPHVADCTKDDSETVISRVMHGFQCRDRLSAQVEHGNRIAVSRLDGYVDVLQGLFELVST